jgi:hypothetical protein
VSRRGVSRASRPTLTYSPRSLDDRLLLVLQGQAIEQVRNHMLAGVVGFDSSAATLPSRMV